MFLLANAVDVSPDALFATSGIAFQRPQHGRAQHGTLAEVTEKRMIPHCKFTDTSDRLHANNLP
jgi:hypothetical protein